MKDELNILFVEDFQSDYELALRQLRKEQILFSSICVDTRAEFLNALESFNPDLIISDYSMPTFNGLEALRITLEKNPDIPFIILTGSINEETAVECMRAGAADYVLKEKLHRLPFSVRETLKLSQERKEKLLAEKQLRESETRFKDVFESANVGKVITSQNKAIVVNQAFADMLGYTRLELQNMDWRDFTPAEDIEHNEKIIAPLYRGEQESIRYQKRYIHKNGSYVWVDISVILHRDAEGEIEYLISTIIDITENKKAEIALRESENKFRSFFQNNHAMMMLIDPSTGDIMDVNPAACAFYGNSREELLTKKITEINTLSLEEVKVEMQKALSEERNYFNFRHRLASSDIRDVEVYSGPIQHSGKHLLYSIIHDVTERKEAELQLRKSEEKFRSFFHNNLSIMLLIDPETGMITDANIAASQFYGYSQNTLLQTNICQINTLPQEEVFVAISRAIGGEKNSFQFQHRLANGEIRDVEVNSSPIEHQGKRILYSIVQDVTDKKYAEHQIRLQATALNAAANAIVITDKNGAIQWVNPSYSHLTGYSLEEVLGKNPRILKSGIQDQAYYKNLWQVILSGQIWQGELVNKRKDGSLYTEYETITPMLDENGNVSHFIAIKEDITQRKQIEKSFKELNELLNLFINYSPIYAYIKEVTDSRISVIIASENYYDMVGIPGSKMAGKTMLELFPTEFAEKIMADDREVVKNGQVLKLDEELNGRFYTTIKFPINQGERTLLAGYTIDITDRKQAEKALEQKVDELLRFHNLTVDRELKMVELKKEVNQLLQNADKPPRYKIIE